MTKAAPGIRLESVTVNPCCVEIRKSQEPLGNREGAAGRLEAPSQNTAFARNTLISKRHIGDFFGWDGKKKIK